MISKRMFRSLFIVFLFILIIGNGSNHFSHDDVQNVNAATSVWTFQGRVYSGDVLDESTPIQGVTISLYGGNNAHPATGTILDSTTTDEHGWYGLTGMEGYEYYKIIETDPAHYISVGATSVHGLIRNSNWIEYVYPIAGKTLTGNKFWDTPGIPTATLTPTATPIPPTFTPTPTPITPTPTPTLDLQVDKIEVVQTIQCLDNSSCPDNAIAMIAGKPTYVRVYVKLVNPPSGGVSNVSAQAIVNFSGGAYSLGVPLNQTITAPLNPQRSNFNHTLNFWLDPWVVNKSGALEVELNHNKTIGESNYSNNKKSMYLSFVGTSQLDIVPVWVKYTSGSNTGVVNSLMPFWMSEYIENILPVGEVKWNYLPGPAMSWSKAIGPDKASWGKLLNAIEDKRKKNSSMPSGAHWYGMIPFKMPSGYISGLGNYPGYSAIGRVPVSYENLENGADIFVHELGHNLNRGHAPCGVSGTTDASYPYTNALLGDYGWDPQGAAGGKVQSLPGGWIVPSNSYDVMSYCQDEWISEYNYRAFLNYRGSWLLQTNSISKNDQAENWKQSVSSQPYLFASGSFENDQIVFDPWIILDRPVGTDDDQGEGSHQLKLVAADESILFERGFDMNVSTPSFNSGNSPAEDQDELQSFYQILPWYNQTASIQLWQGDQLIEERSVTQQPPNIELTSPQSDSYWTTGANYTIQWYGEDPEGQSLWYDLAFSQDNGETWKIFASRLEQNSLEVSGDQFPGSDNAIIRVYASDGVLTSFADSGIFEIEPKSPSITITLPLNGSIIPPDITIPLSGYVFDWEDGMIDGESLQWSSDKDGDLGTGNHILANLSDGLHTILLETADSQDNPAHTSIEIFIGYPVYLPFLNR